MKEIDIILGNNEKKDIVDIVEKYINNNIKNDNVSDISKQKEYIDFGNTTYTEKTRAVVKVQDGCNNFCSYCIIPYSKGRARSRKLDNIISEIKSVVNNGIKEVVITGIHIASYGIDFEENIGLIDLLEEIDKIDELKRIRLRIFRTKNYNRRFCKKIKKTK